MFGICRPECAVCESRPGWIFPLISSPFLQGAVGWLRRPPWCTIQPQHLHDPARTIRVRRGCSQPRSRSSWPEYQSLGKFQRGPTRSGKRARRTLPRRGVRESPRLDAVGNDRSPASESRSDVQLSPCNPERFICGRLIQVSQGNDCIHILGFGCFGRRIRKPELEAARPYSTIRTG